MSLDYRWPDRDDDDADKEQNGREVKTKAAYQLEAEDDMFATETELAMDPVPLPVPVVVVERSAAEREALMALEQSLAVAEAAEQKAAHDKVCHVFIYHAHWQRQRSQGLGCIRDANGTTHQVDARGLHYVVYDQRPDLSGYHCFACVDAIHSLYSADRYQYLDKLHWLMEPHTTLQ